MTVNEKINIPDKSAPVVLVAPLDWGLGHATRCIPLIKHFLLIGCKVIVASEGRQQMLLKQEFTEVSFVHLTGYHIEYSKNTWQTIGKIILQLPKILTAIKNENKWLGNFLSENHVNAVISDNRYGLVNNNVVSVFITHQLTIKSPLGQITEKFLQRLNYRFIEKFTECWVPDFKGSDNLAGELSHPLKLPKITLRYLGKLSRMIRRTDVAISNELLIMLSGPEPQRSILENILLEQLGEYTMPAVLVRGLPGEEKLPACKNKKLLIYNHLSAGSLNQIINQSSVIISRSGYSTVMDLIGLNKKCIFIPTPGQPEQEYLAAYLASKKFCVSFSQDSFILQKAISHVNLCKLNSFKDSEAAEYHLVLEEFVSKLRKDA